MDKGLRRSRMIVGMLSCPRIPFHLSRTISTSFFEPFFRVEGGANIHAAESWVSKGRKLVRVDIKGRGRAGRKHHGSARLHLLLKEGQTQAEKESSKFQKELGRVKSAGVVREDGVLRRKVISGWTW